MTLFKKILITGLLLDSLLSLKAQNDLQKCSAEKNEELNRLLKEGKGSDTSALRKFIQLDKDWKECVTGKNIPDFSGTTIKGEQIKSEDLKGKIIVANFWFTTCPPCVAGIPGFNRLVKEYNNSNVEFLAFAINDKKTLKKFLKKTSFDFKILPDSEKLEEIFGVAEHPVTFVIDQNGKVKIAWAGGSIGEHAKNEAYLKIKPVIDELLGKKMN